jgi:hypothetical protein
MAVLFATMFSPVLTLRDSLTHTVRARGRQSNMK